MIQYKYIYNPTNEITITARVVCIIYYNNIIVYPILGIREFVRYIILYFTLFRYIQNFAVNRAILKRLGSRGARQKWTAVHMYCVFKNKILSVTKYTTV